MKTAAILGKTGLAEIASAKQVSLSSAPTRVSFWGVRGSIPTPGPSTVQYGGNTSCVEIRADGQIIILDAGTGLRLLGQELTAEFGDRSLDVTLLLTHTHWDHIQGLPFFLPVYKPQNHLHILGYEGARHGLENVLSSQMESPFFPIGLREVPANVRIEELKEMSFNIGPVRVQACLVNHPGICVGYRRQRGRNLAPWDNGLGWQPNWPLDFAHRSNSISLRREGNPDPGAALCPCLSDVTVSVETEPLHCAAQSILDFHSGLPIHCFA